MGKNALVKKIFLASPSDTKKERTSVDQIVEEVNQLLNGLIDIRFEVIKWETHAVPAMGRPQDVINHQLRPDQCDLFLGIIWTKFGSPTGGKTTTGILYESGTQEEFEIAYDYWKKHGRPQPFFFRSVKTISSASVNIEQLHKVEEFFAEFSYNKGHPGLYREYRSIAEFEKALRKTLIQYAVSFHLSMDVKEKENTLQLPKTIMQYGIENIFVPDLNNIRNESKMHSLSSTSNIYLIAHSGYSFIAQYGHRFRHIVEEKLKAGHTFKAILTNPWSESGFFISLGEIMSESMDEFYVQEQNGTKHLDCIKIIEKAKWYQVKFKDSINGYNRLLQKYGDKIQIRFTQFEIQSSILLTDSNCYVEPYLPVNLEERYEKGMLTFELKVSNSSYLYRHNRSYFDFLWNLSDDMETYQNNIDNYKHQLQSKLFIDLEV